jgi:hypothetical protein
LDDGIGKYFDMGQTNSRDLSDTAFARNPLCHGAPAEDWELVELIVSLHFLSIRVEAQFYSTDADELGKHRDSFLTGASEIML